MKLDLVKQRLVTQLLQPVKTSLALSASIEGAGIAVPSAPLPIASQSEPGMRKDPRWLSITLHVPTREEAFTKRILDPVPDRATLLADLEASVGDALQANSDNSDAVFKELLDQIKSSQSLWRELEWNVEEINEKLTTSERRRLWRANPVPRTSRHRPPCSGRRPGWWSACRSRLAPGPR